MVATATVTAIAATATREAYSTKDYAAIAGIRLADSGVAQKWQPSAGVVPPMSNFGYAIRIPITTVIVSTEV